MYIIDAHAHIFPQKIAQKAVENIGNFYKIPMDCSGGRAEDLIESGSKAGISQYIISSTATDKKQVKPINSFILEQVKKYKQFIGLITLHPDNNISEIDAQIQFALANGLKGIKLHPDFQQFYIDDKKMYNIYSAAQGVLPILFHTGDKRFNYSNPCRLAAVAKLFKNLKCIAAHFGGYSEWEYVHCYKDNLNVYFDTCSSLMFLPAEKALEIIDLLGEERFMFGTDYPMWEHKAELERFLKLSLSAACKQKILYKNARKIYNIDLIERK